jgi:C1A family cysteine protease
MSSTTLRLYNHKKGLPDDRDVKFTMTLRALAKQNLPVIFDFRQQYPRFMPGILDQGCLGSSTATACSNAIRFVMRKEKARDLEPSRLYMYWFARFVERLSTDEDTGVSLRHLLASIQTYGICDESLHPYNVNTYKTKPSNSCIRSATANATDFKYLSVNCNLSSMKQCLYAGLPIIFGMDVYESFESDKLGVVPMPGSSEILLGSHVALIVGYDDGKQHFIVMNSWGTHWGDNGYFYLPYEYLQYMCDLWTVKFLN